MNPHEGEVPVESAEDWKATIIEPLRAELKRLGIVVDNLTDEDIETISDRVLDKYDGVMPDVQQLAIEVDAVAFKSKLVEEASANAGGTGEDAPTSLGRPLSDTRAEASSAPRSADCPVCIPHKMPYPSGWYVVHSKFCKSSPGQKIRRVGERSVARSNHRLNTSHTIEDLRSGLHIVPRRPDAYHDLDGRDISMPEVGE